MPHISVHCPHCLSRYQLDPSLQGKQLRCPNPQCRCVFEVREESAPATPSRPPAAPPPSSSTVSQVSGSVGEVVPILTAEAVTTPTAAPVEAREAPPPPRRMPDVKAEAPIPDESPGEQSGATWQAAPPPVRRLPAVPSQIESPTSRPSAAAPEPALISIAESEDWLPQDTGEPETREGNARELGPGAWDAPPVRRSSATASDRSESVSVEAPGGQVSEPYVAPRAETAAGKTARRRSRWIVAALLLLLVGGLSLAIWLALGRRAGNEAELFKQAELEYQEHHFADAQVLFQNLQRDFPSSQNLALYRFLAELSDVREAVYFPQGGADGLSKALERVVDFLKIHKGDPVVASHEKEIWQTLYKLGKELGAEAAEQKSRPLLRLAQTALNEASRLPVAATPQNQESLRQAREALNETVKQVVEQERRLALAKTIEELSAKPSSQNVMLARRLVREAGRGEDAQLKELLQLLVKGHAGQVSYSVATASDAAKAPPEDLGTFLLTAPLLGKVVSASFAGTPRTVFALARGVLYALDPRDGQVRWVRRVGIDNHLLPLRLPARAFAPELALVISTDDKTLSALDASSGAVAWQHVLEEPCLGQPVSAAGRIFVPTYSGRVEEIDAGSGKLQGYFRVGEPLTVGGAHQQGTPLLYFPAEGHSIYILDMEKKCCAGILYSGHPRGSLRGPPVIVAQPGKTAQLASGLMILNQAAGLSAVKLPSFTLPIADPDQKPLGPELRAQGWSWFAPFVDGERLILTTDAGALGYWGIKQKGNRDPSLFPWFTHDLTIGQGKPDRAARAQVVHADAERIWTLNNDRLHCLRMSFNAKAGPQVAPAWQEPVPLGVPLHDSQVLRDDTGAAILFLVTQDPRTSTCHASAIAAQDGRVLWQRQLGVVSRGEPVVTGPHILVSDAGGLFLFDAAKMPKEKWQQAGRRATSSSGTTEYRILRGGEKQPTCVLAIDQSESSAKRKLKILSFDPDAKSILGEKEFPLPVALSGSPALAAGSVAVPLANGALHRFPLGDGLPIPGPVWRKSGAEENAQGHVVALEGGDFLVSDGSRGLTRLHWSDSSEKKASEELPARIIAAPAIVAPGKDRKAPSVAVACADNSVSLLDAASLTTLRTWTLPGSITAGPFVHGRGIGCVVGRNRLIWLDPDRPGKDAAWDYFVADIVGGPVWIDDMLVVANQAGQFLAFDPKTGERLGNGYSLRANVGPAAAPVPYDSETLFAPLTDGTVLLLPAKLLR